MSANQEILLDIEEHGRLSAEQEDILYKVIMREDAFSSEPTAMLVDRLLQNEAIMGLVERGYLMYTIINPGHVHEFASLASTYGGVRYGALFAGEIARRQYQ